MKILPFIFLLCGWTIFSYGQNKLVIANPKTYKIGATSHLYQPVGDKVCNLSPNLSDSISKLGQYLHSNPTVNVQINTYAVVGNKYITNGGLASCLLFECKRKLLEEGVLESNINPEKLLMVDELSSVFPVTDNGFRDVNIYFQVKILAQEDMVKMPKQKFEFYKTVPPNRRYFSFNDDSSILPGDIKILDVLFEFNKCNYYPEFTDTLDLLVNFLKLRPNWKVEVGVHTDSRGSKMASQRFDMCRAESVKKYLISKGISTENIMFAGYGETMPIISDDIIAAAPNEETREHYHKINRRVEVKILSAE